MNANKGTPKTLAEAIDNGLLNAHDPLIEDHVRDFLAQRFSTAMLRNPEIESILGKLFEEITKKEAA